MTVINNDARDQYIATGGQTIFNYTFEIADQINIQVFQRAASSPPNDVADLLVLGTDYTVTGVGVNTGGTIILNTGATDGDIVTLQGNAPPIRSTSFTPGGVIQAQNLNTEFDDEVLIYQTILGVQDFLVPKYPKSAVVFDFDLVLPLLGANQTWVMNQNNDEIIAADFPSEGSASKNSTFVTITDERAQEPNSFPLSEIGSGFMVNKAGTEIITRALQGVVNQIVITDPDGVDAAPIIGIANDPILGGNAGMGIPQGTTGQRVTPLAGIALRYNTTISQIEYWNGSAWMQLSVSSGFYLPLSGGTMTGNIDMDGNYLTSLPLPVDPSDAVPLSYLSSALDDFLLLSGGTMDGNIDMNGNMVTGLDAPSNGSDATNKDYVDGLISFPIDVPEGGTGLTSTTPYGLITGGASPTDPLQNAGTGTAGQIYQSGGAGALGSWVSQIPPSRVRGTFPCTGRLTVTSGQPVSNTGGIQSTLYFTPYKGNIISLYDGSNWITSNFGEIPITIPSTTDTVYDVFIYNNSGTITYQLIAWASANSRASSVGLLNGVYVLGSDNTKRYVGTFRTNSTSANTQDDASARYVWNYYNRVKRNMIVTDATSSWTYTSGTVRQANGNAANQLNFVLGFPEDIVTARMTQNWQGSSTSSNAGNGIGLNQTTTNNAQEGSNTQVQVASVGRTLNIMNYTALPTFGYNFLAWLESGATTVTFYGGFQQSGLTGEVWA